MLNITFDLKNEGLKITCYSPLGVIKIPLFLNSNEKLKDFSARDFEKLNLLDSFWQEGLVEEGNDNSFCIMPYDKLYDITREEQKFLALPMERNITVSVKAKGILGKLSFDMNYQLYLDGVKLGKLFRRYKNIIYFGKEYILIPEKVYRLISEIDKYVSTADNIKQAKFIAKVKHKAELAGAKIDKFLQTEEVYIPDKLDVDIKKHSDEYLELLPKFNEDVEKVIEGQKGKLKSTKTFHGKGIRRKRVFLDDDIKQSYNKIIEKKDIKGSDVPRFLTDPYSFIPQTLDISNFGKRVKELGLRVYRANPYINVNPDKKSSGWFEFDTGGIIDPLMYDDDFDEGQEKEDQAHSEKIDIEELEELVKKAEEQGEEYVYYKGKWIDIDISQTRKFIDICERELGKREKVDLSRLPYVLKIFENIHILEYDETALNLKNQLIARFDISQFEQPENLVNCELFDHQKEGYLWMQNLRQNHLGGLLADDMGLGKTLQVISFMCFLKDYDILGPSIVIAPSTLLGVWEREINKFSKITSVYQHRGPMRYKDIEMIKGYDVVLTTYETLVRDQLILGQIDWQLVVCDEAQKIKNSTTLSTIVVKALKAKTRIAVTGTPVENNLGELWCIVDFVQPGLLKSYNEFKINFQKPIEDAIEEDSSCDEIRRNLLETIKPVYIRREKEDILDLPEKHEFAFGTRLSSSQEEIYCKLIAKYKASEAKKGKALGLIQKLIQVCAHPRLIKPGIASVKQLIDESGKLQLILDILDKIQQKNEKAVIFTHFKRMQAILKKVLLDRYEINCSVINGDVKGDRMRIIDHFQKTPGFSVIILSTRAAGVGITVTAANNVIHYTRSWNPAVENQASDRVYRIGQEKEVNIYYPIAISSRGKTVDERLNEVLKRKRALAQNIIIPSKRIKVRKKDFDYILQDMHKFA